MIHFFECPKLLVIHFEIIFVKDTRSVSRFFPCECPVVPALFLKRVSFLHCIAFASLSKISRLHLCWSISCLSICSHICISYKSYSYNIRFIPNYFIFCGANINGIVFFISNFTCSLLIYWKVVDFYILTLYLANLL